MLAEYINKIIMIKQTLKENILLVSISNVDFSYRIPLKKIGNKIDWKIGKKETEGITIPAVSTWTLQLFTKQVTESKYVKEFMTIVMEHAPENTIDWEKTLLAVNVQNQYNWLSETNKTAKNKQTEIEIIESLKKKFNLD